MKVTVTFHRALLAFGLYFKLLKIPLSITERWIFILSFALLKISLLSHFYDDKQI